MASAAKKEAADALAEIIRKFYRSIDSSDWDSMCNSVSSEIEYTRGEVVISGLAKFRNFYAKVRDLTGRHSIAEIDAKGSEVYVKGSFKGYKGKKETEFDFTDHFIFDADGKISKRETMIF